MKNNFPILHILTRVCDNQSSHTETNFLVELTRNYAYTYLRYRYKTLGKVLLAEDVTLNELAIDAIAPLFEKDDSGCFIKIKTAFNNWQPPIEPQCIF